MKTQLKQTAQKGFTLVELMIVLAIIGVLVGAAIPAYQGYIKGAKIGTYEQNCAYAKRIVLNEWAKYQLTRDPVNILNSLNAVNGNGVATNLLADGTTPVYSATIPTSGDSTDTDVGAVGIDGLETIDTVDSAVPATGGEIQIVCKGVEGTITFDETFDLSNN